MIMMMKVALLASALFSGLAFSQPCGGGLSTCGCEGIDFQSRAAAIDYLKVLNNGGFISFDVNVLGDLENIIAENIRLEKIEKAKKFLVPAILAPLLLN